MSRRFPAQISTDTDWAQIVCGDFWTFAIKTNGTLWAWGRNELGQLGNNTILDIPVPTQIGTDTNWSSVATGKWNTFALKTDGTLWGWGSNFYSTIGDGTTVDKLVPTQVGTATNWAKIAMGYYHVLVIKTNGSLWGWGSNFVGEIGLGTKDQYITTPTQIGTDTNWSEISGGNVHSIAIKTNGTMWAFGANFVGQLGLAGVELGDDVLVPTQIGTDSNWQKIAVGLAHNLALKTDGTLWAWGLNNSAQIGNGERDINISNSVLTPLQIGTETTWDRISAGSHNSFAIKTNGENWAWGYGANGALGDGVAGYRLVPTQIDCNALGNEEVTAEKIGVYPNPAKDLVNIDASGFPIQKLELFDIQGRLMLSEVLAVAENQHQLNISRFAKGNYVLKITTGSATQNIKIIKD